MYWPWFLNPPVSRAFDPLPVSAGGVLLGFPEFSTLEEWSEPGLVVPTLPAGLCAVPMFVGAPTLAGPRPCANKLPTDTNRTVTARKCFIVISFHLLDDQGIRLSGYGIQTRIASYLFAKTMTRFDPSHWFLCGWLATNSGAHSCRRWKRFYADAWARAGFLLTYVVTSRNLWAAIVAHGVPDTTAFVMMYFGMYPGL